MSLYVCTSLCYQRIVHICDVMQELNISLIVHVTAGVHTVFHVTGDVIIAPSTDQVT